MDLNQFDFAKNKELNVHFFKADQNETILDYIILDLLVSRDLSRSLAVTIFKRDGSSFLHESFQNNIAPV